MPVEVFVEQAAAVALVFCRLGGFVVLSPFPGRWVPGRVRAVLTLVLALPLSFGLTVPPGLHLDLSLLLPAASNVIVGLMVGAAFRFMLAAAEIMAGMVSQASWLSRPMAFDPNTGASSQVLVQVSTLLAMMLALSIGAHRVVLAYLIESFRVLPLTAPTHITASLPIVLELAGRAFDVGMRLAIPVFAVSLAVQAALAVVSRVAPSLQIFNIGFTVLVASGLLVFGASMRAMSAGLVRLFGTLPAVLDGALGALGGA